MSPSDKAHGPLFYQVLIETNELKVNVRKVEENIKC